MIFTVDAVAGIKKAWEFGPLTRINCHVSSSTVPVKLKNENPSWLYGIIKKRQSSRQDGIKRRTEISLGLEVRQDGSSWPWDPFLRLVTASKDGRGLNDREWLDLEDARFCELGFLFVSWASYSTNGEIEDIYGQITLVVSSKLLTWILVDWGETFWLERTWSRSIDLQNRFVLLKLWI